MHVDSLKIEKGYATSDDTAPFRALGKHGNTLEAERFAHLDLVFQHSENLDVPALNDGRLPQHSAERFGTPNSERRPVERRDSRRLTPCPCA